MSFASPGYLALLALAPLAAAAYLALARWRRRAAARFAPGRDARELSPAVGSSWRVGKAALVVLAVAMLALALARPRLGQQEVVVEQEGADIVIALDVSRSMLVEDVPPHRLALAQRETVALLDRLRGHRVGLVLFARGALLRSPMTTDAGSLRLLVQSAGEDRVLVAPGSDLGGAVRTALRALEAGEAESRAIVLVSDGEDHEGDALAAAREAGSEGVVIFAAGMGTDVGGPVPAADPEAGAAPVVVSERNEVLLRRMAAATAQGDYVPGERLAGLAGAIDRLERSPFAPERRSLPTERFQWAVLAALALLALEALLPERRPGGWRLPRWPQSVGMARPAHLLVLVAVLGVACSSSAGRLIADGNRAYDRGDYEAALEAYLRAGVRAPERAEPHANAGLALHQLERYEEATTETARALPGDEPLLAARLHYNLGNHYFRLDRFPEALEAYRDALGLNPGDRDAKYNLELVLRAIAELPVEESSAAAADGVDAGPGSGDGEGPADGEEPAGREEAEGVADATEAAQRSLAEALAGIDEEFTVVEALRALDLAQELNRLLPLAGAGAGSADVPDW